MKYNPLTVKILLVFGLLSQGAASLAAKTVSVSLIPAESIVRFTGHSMNNILSFTGEGKGVTGDFNISGPKTMTGHAIFPMNNLEIELATRAKHMKEDLEVTTYPEAKFVPTILPWEDPSQVLSKETAEMPFTGKLTLHGVEKPVLGKVSTTAQADKVEYKFSFDVALEDFGIKRRTFAGLQVGKIVNVVVMTRGKVVAQ